MAAHAFLEHSGILAFAHRGDQDSAPENTASAFGAAVRLGFEYIETDVRATADGVLLIFHDQYLDRLADQSGRIDRMNWSELRHVRVAGTEPIPRLDEMLEAFPDIRFNIEPKSDRAVQLLVDIIQHTRAEQRVCVGSFSDQRLRLFRSALPDVCTSMGRTETTKARLYSMGLPLNLGSAACAQVPPQWRGISIVDRRFVEAMKKNDLQTHVWTVNDQKEMNRWINLGVEGLMTDKPAELKKILIARGLWH
ncbi:MAG: glycerophosphodiester phosphodiesterase [Acidiferrobacteraceae bacterium]|nr:glycerophosphodiester phosphodiesterase [Acidiferrobacteraceae bacterium]